MISHTIPKEIVTPPFFSLMLPTAHTTPLKFWDGTTKRPRGLQGCGVSVGAQLGHGREKKSYIPDQQANPKEHPRKMPRTQNRLIDHSLLSVPVERKMDGPPSGQA